jgi:protein-L-isoaspartate(D-aspartate) O-methyltransferase
MRLAETNEELVRLVRYRADQYLGGGIRDGRVLEAMKLVDRARFLPQLVLWAAYLDEPVAIGQGQTCSQPSMVAFMLDKLELESGQRVLEIGSGCGYAAAIVAVLVHPGGSVFASELLGELSMMARANCAAAGFHGGSFADSITFLEGDGSAGYPDRGPFDRILLSAGVRHSSFRDSVLIDQLCDNGILVYPEARGNLYRVIKRGASLIRDRWPGVAFVPLKGRNA